MLNIYGASDDLVELDGDIYEELNPTSSELDYDGYWVGLSNGVVIKVVYSGLWLLRVVENPSDQDVTLYPAGSEEAVEIAENDYSDVIAVNETISWAIGGQLYASK